MARIADALCHLLTDAASRSRLGTAEQEAAALQSDPNLVLNAELQHVRDHLVLVTRHGWVNPKSRASFRAGLRSFKRKGRAYHEAALKAGCFSPGAEVDLVREPDNLHDANAIAVYADSTRSRAGYVPASRLREWHG